MKPMEPERVGIIGAGAMGTCLSAIMGGHLPTVVVCRNPRRAGVLFERGARVNGLIEAASRPIVVGRIADLARVGPFSTIFVATKTSAIPEVAGELGPLLASGSLGPEPPFVVSFQNGIEPGRQLMESMDYRRVLRMVLSFGARLDEASGDAQALFFDPPDYIGGDPKYHEACRRLADLLTRAGLETRTDPDIELRVWSKAIVNAAMNPVAALVNSTVGEVMASPAARIVERLLEEGLTVAEAEGLDLGRDYLDRSRAFIARAGDHVPSMVQDIRSGRESEVGQLNRQIMRHGKKLGVPTPTHEIIDALIETFDWRVYRKLHSESPTDPA